MDGADTGGWRPVFRRRSQWLLGGIFVWLLILAAQLFWFMVFARRQYIRRYAAPSWRIGALPALRGRILSRNGIPLAWSVRTFRLLYKVPADADTATADGRALQGRLDQPTGITLARIRAGTGREVTLSDNLHPSELVRLQPLTTTNPRFRIENHFRRETLRVTSTLGERLGHTRLVDGTEVGVSGLERMHDRRLRGRDGRYRVMVDKNGQWIDETWREIQPPVPGFDVYVGITVQADAVEAPRPPPSR